MTWMGHRGHRTGRALRRREEERRLAEREHSNEQIRKFTTAALVAVALVGAAKCSSCFEGHSPASETIQK